MSLYKYPKDFMLQLIQYSYERLAQQFNVHKSTLKEWVRKFETFGESVFDSSSTQR